jgi:hypothetical protein
MEAAHLTERLGRALAPEYTVDREVASGGMGSVFLAHDTALDRPVAVKVMRPELATARAAERFLHEARTLASLRHPNVVPVHRAGEADGLFYYIMEYVAGETLEQRLRRGPLPPTDALKLGRDLLDGLEAAHRAGIIHRDLKPANIFLVGSRALLGDFGISRSISAAAEQPTTEGRKVGTPGYQPPEQAAGAEATVRTDVYAAATVLYEAFTGRRWPYDDAADWSGVPRAVARVLRRGLAWAPKDRWPDAASFRKALWRTRTRRYVQYTVLLTGAGLVAGVAGALFLVPRMAAADDTGVLQLVVPSFVVAGPIPGPNAGDSLAALLRNTLTGYADFTVVRGGARAGAHGPVLTLSGRLEVDGPSARARLEGRGGQGRTPLLAEARVPLADWRALADSLAYPVLLAIWNAEGSLAASLPLRTLPHSTRGLAAFLAAERLVAQARWGEAYQAYASAEAIDSTCWLCSWRLEEVERWISFEHDPARARRYLAHIDSFPPAYRSLIRASRVPVPARLDTLRAATQRAPDFFLVWFQQGDELFHRGPLAGHRRSEAIASLEQAGALRPDFGPTWEHLAWARIAEGDSAGAVSALVSLEQTGTPRDPFSAQIRGLLRLGFAWRFLPPQEAMRRTTQEVTPATVAAYPDVAAGPRLLPTFDAPLGAIALGKSFASLRGRSDVERSGLIAQVLGAVAVGEPVAALAAAHTLRERFDEPDVQLFAAELAGALALVDSAVPAGDALAALRSLAARGTGSDDARRRAAWMFTLLQRRAPSAGDTAAGGELLRGEPPPRPLTTLLAADAAGIAGQWSRALDLSDDIAVDSTARQLDPFFRSVTRLLRASWFDHLGNVAAARRELRWHEHTHVVGALAGPPQAGEIDWAMGTIARWRTARLLDQSGETGAELCAAYAAVQRLWTDGSARYVARADTARQRYGALKCAAASS